MSKCCDTFFMGKKKTQLDFKITTARIAGKKVKYFSYFTLGVIINELRDISM